MSHEPKLYDGQQWGEWVFDADLLTLTNSKPYAYQIDLELITDSAQLLDWIYQIRLKTWCTPKLISDLLDAFADIFDPQGTLCSFGMSKTIDPETVIEDHINVFNFERPWKHSNR